MDTWIYLSQGFAVAMTPGMAILIPPVLRLLRKRRAKPAQEAG